MTDRSNVNVDCLLLAGPDYPSDTDADTELQAGLPFIELKLVRQEQFDLFVRDFFATDRDNTPKGMIEVLL